MQKYRLYPRLLTHGILLALLGGLFGCYSQRELNNARLNVIPLDSLHFYAVTPPANQKDTYQLLGSIDLSPKALPAGMWALQGVKTDSTALAAHFKRVDRAFMQQFFDKKKRQHQEDVLIHVSPETAAAWKDSAWITLPFAQIVRIEVFEYDAGKTVGLVLGTLVGTAGVMAAIVLAACSCPYVYTDAPGGIQPLGELYAAAAYPQLERHDWLLLPNLQAPDQQYNITIANKLHENQHNNLLELEVIDHAPGQPPLFDKYGRLHTLATPRPPLAAADAAGHDVLDAVSAEDGRVFSGDPQNDRPDANERVQLTFAKPAGAQQAKLLINARNSAWLNYIYYQFQDELGVYGPRIREQYRRKSAAENQAWLNRQKIPLAVWLETAPGRWEKMDYFQPIGPLALRNDVLPIDLRRVQGDSLRLRLEYGFHFWEIDYVALDCSPDAPVIRQTLAPLSAVTQTGEDVTAALSADDDRYYDQPNIGDEARVSFAAPPQQPGMERTVILHAKGHYDIRYEPAAGRPNLFRLKAWDKENALPRLSRRRWIEAGAFASNASF